MLAGAEGEEVAIGAIIGAPFMLGTVAMMLIAGAALAYSKRRESGREIDADKRAVRRDLGFFLPCFAAAIALGLVDSKPLHYAGAAVLLVVYGVLRGPHGQEGRGRRGGGAQAALLRHLEERPAQQLPARRSSWWWAC